MTLRENATFAHSSFNPVLSVWDNVMQIAVSSTSISLYKVIELLRALSLVDRCV